MDIRIFFRKAKSLTKTLICRIVFPYYKRHGTPKVFSIEETIKLVVKHHLSVTRFGDGEYFHLCKVSTGLQKSDDNLKNKLIETILNRNPKLLVCMVDLLNQKNSLLSTKLAESYFYVLTYKKIKQYVDANRQYGNTKMTRFYIDSVDKSQCGSYFNLCKQIWEGEDVVIFEGDKTRFGVGNDLFDNVKSIRRILCPSKNAFMYYDQILTTAKTFDKKNLLLFSLGITATVAASDLTNEGFRVIDIGNLDTEYEWYRLGATKKVAIKGKQVSEVTGGTNVEEIMDEDYLSQIAGKIGIE